MLNMTEAIRTAVDELIEAERQTVIAPPPLDAAVQRLAELSPLKYDQVRRAEAKALGVRPGTPEPSIP